MAKNNLSLYSALAANLLIAVVKFVAGTATGSSAMIAEGVHSMVDMLNELLILYGIRRSRKPPDRLKPLGYGKELYFWSFIVSILIFGLGGGISVYQGVEHIIAPNQLGDPKWNYIVLGLSFLFDGTSLAIAIKSFKVGADETWWQAIVNSKDPSSFLVLFEDAAAVIGLFIVFAFMLIGHALHFAQADGIASVLVGLLLVCSSAILARESRSLLMGEGISDGSRQKIRQLAEQDSAVRKVNNIFSTYQSPDEVFLVMLITFNDDLDTRDLTDAIDRLRRNIKKQFTRVHFVIIQPQDGK